MMQISVYDETVEQGVLGMCLRDASAVEVAVAQLAPEHFFHDRHRLIFRAIQHLHRQGASVDASTVARELMRNNWYEVVGESPYLVQLVDEAPPSSVVIAGHAAILTDCASRQSLADVCKDVLGKAIDRKGDLAELVTQVRRTLDAITTVHDDLPVTCLAEVQPEAVSWLWPGRIARGKLTLLVGDPGLGKSYVTHDIAARVSVGGSWPDGTPATVGNVILLTAEDGLADTVRPRLDALGGDPAHVFAVPAHGAGTREHGVDLIHDLGRLESLLKAKGAALVVIDPLSAYLGKVDSYKDSEVRAALAPIAALAERSGVPFLGVMHLNKAQQREAIHRTQGSIAFVAAARAVHALVADPQDSERRLLLPVKMNISRKPSGLAFRIVETNGLARIAWDPEPVVLDINDIFLEGNEPPSGRPKRKAAIEWLEDLLQSGPVPAEEVKERATRWKIAEHTLERAKKELQVMSSRVGDQWWWALPPKIAKGANNVSVGSLAIDPSQN